MRTALTFLVTKRNSLDPSAPRIEDVIKRIVKDVPDEEWEKLPHDLTDRLDYYLYGVEDDGVEDE